MLLVIAIYNKKYQEMSFDLKNLFTGRTQNPSLEKIVVIMKNERVNFCFPRLWMTLLEQKLKWPDVL